MKNNIRYKGNTNNTSIIFFFFKSKVKNFQRWYFTRENLRGRFCCCCSFILSMFFIFVLHFIFDLHVVVNLHSLLFDIIPHPSVDYRWVFAPTLYFEPSPSQSDSRHFHFQPFRDFLTASTTVLSGRFLPTGAFYLTLLHQHF